MKVFQGQVDALVGDALDFTLPEFPRLRFSLNCSGPDAILTARDERGDIVPPPPVESVLAAMRYVRSPAWEEGRRFDNPVCLDPPRIALSASSDDLVPGEELFVEAYGEWKFPPQMAAEEFPVQRYWTREDGMPLAHGDSETYVLGDDDVGHSLMVIENVLDETARSNLIGPVGRRVV